MKALAAQLLAALEARHRPAGTAGTGTPEPEPAGDTGARG
jgi:hypothetical protein